MDVGLQKKVGAGTPLTADITRYWVCTVIVFFI